MYTPGPGQLPQAQTPAAQEAPQPQAKPKAPGKSKNGDVGAFIQQCISLASYLKELQTQAHLIHLNYEGSNFLGVHAFLKDQYEAHLEQFDALAEGCAPGHPRRVCVFGCARYNGHHFMCAVQGKIKTHSWIIQHQFLVVSDHGLMSVGQAIDGIERMKDIVFGLLHSIRLP